jgi:hypothetical protein
MVAEQPPAFWHRRAAKKKHASLCRRAAAAKTSCRSSPRRSSDVPKRIGAFEVMFVMLNAQLNVQDPRPSSPNAF